MTPAEAGGLRINVPFYLPQSRSDFFSLVPQKTKNFIWLFLACQKEAWHPRRRLFFSRDLISLDPILSWEWIDYRRCWYPWCRYIHLKLDVQGLPMLQMINSWIQKHHFYLRLKKFLSTVICQQLPKKFKNHWFRSKNVCSSLSSLSKKKTVGIRWKTGPLWHDDLCGMVFHVRIFLLF